MTATSKGYQQSRCLFASGKDLSQTRKGGPFSGRSCNIYLSEPKDILKCIELKRGKAKEAVTFPGLDFTISLHPDSPGTSQESSSSWDNYCCCPYEEAPMKSQLNHKDSIVGVENNRFHLQFGMAAFGNNFLREHWRSQGGERTHFIGKDLGR